ncbi:hypothetical protein [Desulfosporosinus nitroreducens]|uniref:hypothetical protein n=1 Tax=Desulfosporosinus nitroreducens TaxID=2018668 RepID=UPI00207D2AAB|nr:hypothetical protein [Desulfosporosinus nitroreducens]MCO1603188.1 hypothetical protein [Desulfosporosinus nitroreducens]
MVLRNNRLTSINNIPITIASSNKEQVINQLNNLNLTFTGAIDQSELFIDLNQKLGNLESKGTVSEDEISSILPMLENLTLGSDNRLECDFRMRSLKKKFKSSATVKQKMIKTVITRQQILQTINQSIDIDEVNEALIELNEKDYINLGKEGRLSVVEQIVQLKKNYQTEQELIEVLLEKCNYMNHLLDTLNSVKDRLEYILVLEKMKLPMYLSLSKEIKDKIVDHLIHPNTTFSSVSSLARAIQKTYQSMDIVTPTLNMKNQFERALLDVSE